MSNFWGAVHTLHLVEYFFVKEMEKVMCCYFQIFENNSFEYLNSFSRENVNSKFIGTGIK